MKLDLLYEFQPKIKPWTKPHPYGQRDAEQRTYDEAIAEIQYADKLGFNTVWVVEHHFRDGRSASPCSEAILGGLALSHRADQAGLRRDADAVRVHPPGPGGREGGDRRRALHGRVEWGTGRSTPMEQAAFGVPTDDRSREQWQEAVEIVVRHVGAGAVLLGQRQPALPRADADPQAVPGPAPAVLAGGGVARRAP